MKRRNVLALTALLVSVMSFGQKMKISGKAPADVAAVRLMEFNGETLGYDQIELIPVRQGKYSVKFRLSQPNLYKLVAGEKELRLSLSQVSDIVVNFDKNEPEVVGSDESLSMKAFSRKNGELQAKHFGALKKEADEAMARGDKEALVAIQKKSGQAIAAFLKEFRRAIIEMGETPAGYYALQFSDFNKEIDFISERLRAYQASIPNSPVTRALEKQVYRAKVVAIGMCPPAIAVEDSEGKPFQLDQYLGKVLLIDFWAAWCRACRIENPQFVTLYQEFKDSGLEIVSISQDKKVKTWQEAIEKDGIGIWRQVQDKEGAVSELYSVSSLPQNLVIGKDGKIIGKNVNAESLKQLLKAHL